MNPIYSSNPSATNLAKDKYVANVAGQPTPTDTAYDSYLKALAPTTEETAAKTNLTELNSAAKFAREKALDSGETMGFAGGEAARVGRNNDLTISAASDTYNALKDSGDNNRNILKAKYDYIKGKSDSEAAIERENTKPFELSQGQQRYTYDKATKQYKLTANVAPKAAAIKSTSSKVKAPTKASAILSDINDVISQLSNHQTEKKQKGIDQNGYNNAIKYLQQTHGSSAVKELDKALYNNKLSVDKTIYKK